MATEKTVLEQVNNFLDGIYDTAVGAPIAFGDFLAKISGYRDYQFTSGSVINGLNSDLIQKQTMNEMRILYEALKYKETYLTMKDFLIQDIQNRPTYYLGSAGASFGISSTISISKDYDTYTIGNSKFQNQTTITTPVKQSVSYITPTSNYISVLSPISNYSNLVKSVIAPAVPNSNFDRKISLVKFISLSNRFYQAKLFDLDLKEVA